MLKDDEDFKKQIQERVTELTSSKLIDDYMNSVWKVTLEREK